ncbi:hypothetical protein M4D52_05390 [Paenibacillus lactis]|uniref:hypothetical protein n=1 Tax=Paenibacillus lactis TaxID=228574 RepID=UPI00203A58DC|nr:hypothetical protein [Paenibacillus lactis]MCM3492874.1 hypothetical protein [Paenibacillus lactis]
MTPEKFTEIMDEKIFELLKEIRDEHGASNLIIKQDSCYGDGTIEIKIEEKPGV